MPTGQANRASVLTSACLRASGASPRHSAISCARSSKRTVRLISGVALDECLDPERYRTCAPIVPIAQSTERARPKRQVAGGSLAGDTSFCGCGSTAECGRAKAETTVRLRSPAPFWGRSSSAERSFDMREAKRAALFVPTIIEGIAQPARADASHASGQRCNSFCPHHLLSLWCSPVNMPASHAGDHRSEAGQGRQFLGAWFTGNSRPTWLRTRQPWTCKSSRADHFRCPQSIVSDASAR